MEDLFDIVDGRDGEEAAQLLADELGQQAFAETDVRHKEQFPLQAEQQRLARTQHSQCMVRRRRVARVWC